MSPEATVVRFSLGWMRRHLACIFCLLLVALVLWPRRLDRVHRSVDSLTIAGWHSNDDVSIVSVNASAIVSLFTGRIRGFKTTYCEDSVLEQLLLGKAIVDGPMKANSTSPEGARLYRQSKVQIKTYLEVCNQCRTYLAWAAFHIRQVTLKVVTPCNPLQAWGRVL